MGHVVKSGYLKRYSKSILSGGWQNVWVVLYQDSTLYLYKRQGDSDIKGKVLMKEVAKRFAYGRYTDGLPDRPPPPPGQQYDNVLAIPQKNNSKAKIYWFLCNSEAELHEWMQAICSTLPQPSQGHHHQQQQQQHSQPVSSAPPPYASAPPPMPMGGGGGGLGFDAIAGAPPPAGYQPPPGPAPYPTQQYASPYPQQGYQQPYPQQQYAPQGYPQQPGYQQPYQQQQPGYYQQPAAGYAYPQGQYGYQQPAGYAGQPNVVYVQQQPHKSKSGGMLGGLGGNKTKLAAGVLGGAALGYGASRMMGGFGGWGFGHHGSWSSLSSFGSCGSFGSFGSFD